ncbi:hypothetical protein ACQEVM_12530 [Streptomyces sp. CA-243310]|uniref:hypothetical protein n=1 Tax=Streptomyces sp. CA-243310 TaxID=3240056 RepID=UPI003D90755B
MRVSNLVAAAVIAGLALSPATALAVPARQTTQAAAVSGAAADNGERCVTETHRLSPFLTVELGADQGGPFARITLLTIAADGTPVYSVLAVLTRDNPHVIHERRWMRIFEGAFETGFTNSSAIMRIDFPAGCHSHQGDPGEHGRPRPTA